MYADIFQRASSSHRRLVVPPRILLSPHTSFILCLFVSCALPISPQWAIITGLLGLQRASDVIIATLCKFTVPRWHGQELLSSTEPRGSVVGVGVGVGGVSHSSETFRWRHVQATVRLLQIVHALADVITDWDATMDCFEQLTVFIASPRSVFHEDVTSLELERISLAIERFKTFTVFVSDEALVRLMTSLVALSLNALAVSASSTTMSSSGLVSSPLGSTSNPSSNSLNSGPGGGGSSSGTAGGLQSGLSTFNAASATIDTVLRRTVTSGANMLQIPNSATATNLNATTASVQYQHLLDNAANGGSTSASYSLMAAVDIAKCNSYRVSCVWQMVVSHLRMVASHKVSP